MAPIVEANSLFQIDMELDGLLDEISSFVSIAMVLYASPLLRLLRCETNCEGN